MLSPMRIIMFAILLSFALQVAVKVDSHGVKTKDALLLRPPNTQKFFSILLAKRSQPMYAPLSYNARKALIKKGERRRKWWNFIDFCNAVCFIIVINFIIYHLWTSHYQEVGHLRKAFINFKSDHYGAVDPCSINNTRGINKYLEVNFITKVFNLRWYNSLPLKETENAPEGIAKYWAENCLQKMIGLPAVRQVRVMPKKCDNAFFPNIHYCLSGWSFTDEDKNIYGEKWVPADYDTQENSPWAFQDRHTNLWFTNTRFYGDFLYDVSGYVATLGPTKNKAEMTLFALAKANWVDEFTRAIFLEISMYNVNNRLFCQISVLFESFVVGLFKTRVAVAPVSRNVLVTAWEVIFAAYVIYYTLRSGYLINRNGLMDYMKNINNSVRVITVFLSYTAIVLWCIHHRTSITYVGKFLKSTKEDYFEFDMFIRNFTLLKWTLSFLLCFMIFRVFLLLRGGRRLINSYYTFLISINWMCWLSFLLLILLSIFCLIAKLLEIHQAFSWVEIIIPKDTNKSLEFSHLEKLDVRVVLTFKVIIMGLIKFLFLLLFIYYTKPAKSYNLKETDKFNFGPFIAEEIGRFRRRKSTIVPE